MRELAAELKEKWAEKHREEAEDAFALVKEEGQKASGPSFFQKSEQPATALAAKKN